LAALSAMAGDPDKDQKALRLDAIAALGRMGGEEALALLRRIAFDKDKKAGDEAVRKAAFRAFKRAQRQADKARKYEAQA
jgi:HEAT repeat protein